MSFWSRLFGGGRKKSSKPLATSAGASSPSPNPAAVAARREVELGAYTFCGLTTERPEYDKVTGTECPYRRPWESSTAANRNLLLGKMDLRDPAVTKTRLGWMRDAKLKWAIYQVQHPHALTTPDRIPMERRDAPALLMTYCADNHFIGSGVRFTFANWDVNAGKEKNYWKELNWGYDEAENSWRVYIRSIAPYLQHPDWFDIDGKLVLFHGGAENLSFYETMYGLKPERIVEVWREEVRKATGKELYLMAVNTATQHPESEDVNERVFLKEMGFDGFCHYLLNSSNATWEDAMATYKYWRERDVRAAKRAGLKYWAAATSGFDPRGWYEHPDHYTPTAAQFLAHLRDTMQFAANNYPVTELKVPIYAIGETYEGGEISPFLPNQLHDGDEMLRACTLATA